MLHASDANRLQGADHEAVGTILAVIRQRTGLDFRGYRAATIQRRILNRMSVLGIADLPEYARFLEGSEAETIPLIERLTIKVSRFYRNPVTFESLRRQVLPALRAARAGEPLRIWSAGCGYGEEAYTLAMLLEEAGVPGAVEATDIDTIALELARVAAYPSDAVSELPGDLADRYLTPVPHRGETWHSVAESVRARVRFATHDLMTTAPVPGGPFDLVSCRNVLIYLERPVQTLVIETVLRALAPGGVVCLGETEWPPAPAPLTALDQRARIFRIAAGPPAGALS